MNRDPAKPILDSLLEEVLCDLSPPDVTERVLRALDPLAPDFGTQDGASSEASSPSPSRTVAAPQANHEPPTLAPAVTRATRSKSPSSVDSTHPVSLADGRPHASWKAPVFWMACGALLDPSWTNPANSALFGNLLSLF